MSIIRALCLLLVGAMVAAAQEPNSAPQKSNEKTSDLCSVEGVVVKSTTGEGIKRVTVQLTPLGGESGLTISRSQPPARLEIVLSPDGGRVDGSVLQEQHPIGGAWVVLVPDSPHRDREDIYSMKATDGFGRFSLLGLPPGDFKLFAWEPVQGTNYTDPDFFGAFEGRGTPVHITERQQQTVQLEVITAEDQVR